MKNFRYALNGIYCALKSERNMRIHVLIFLIMVAMGIFYQISYLQWTIQLILSAMVIGAELVNTAIERVTNVLFPNYHKEAKVIKDVAAGGVLTICFFAFLIGCIIYIPLIFRL